MERCIDMKLPCDVVVGRTVIGKGVKLQTVLLSLQNHGMNLEPLLRAEREVERLQNVVDRMIEQEDLE